MGVAERKEREKLELKEKIIDAATELFLSKGIDKTSIRQIADKIEYSPATIYLHFNDKNELFYIIMERSFQLFFNHLSVVKSIQDPMQRLVALGRKYLEFVAKHPSNYDLMLVERDPMQTEHTEERWENGMKSHGILKDTVAQCIQQGHFQGHDPESLSLAIWSAVHGLATLKLRDRLNMYEEGHRNHLVTDALESLNKMLQSL